MSRADVVNAYRQLYKHSLRAVQFSKPARYTIRSRLRECFRKGSAQDFNQARVDNTVEFLKAATREKGLEHKIVKNLTHLWFHQPYYMQNRWSGPTKAEIAFKMNAYDHYNHTINMLNESMEICLPPLPVR